MTNDLCDKFTGTPIDRWVEQVPDELPVDAVGLWQVIPGLRINFGLSGLVLEQYARKIIHRLLARGAWPVTGAGAGSGAWIKLTRHGDNPDDIVDAVIAEWHASGRDPDVGDTWFPLPKFYE